MTGGQSRVLAAFAFVGTFSEAAASPESPNVIIILLDDLHLNGMGVLNPQLKTLNIEALARKGPPARSRSRAAT